MRILFILLFLASLNLNAQDRPVGIKIGSNVSNLVGDGTQNIDLTVNLQAGFYMELPASEKAIFLAELLYTGYGFKIENTGETSDIILNYIALSVSSKIFLFEKFSLDAGPQVSLLVSAKDKEGYISNLKSDFYNRDFGVNLGMSYGISEKIMASFRYYVGLTDVTIIKNKNFNRAFQLAFQYKIN
ncbi:porin family protein [Winogradskyella sp. PG-2]|uniref:porin family protein n=1 Tax=Winogradskyella sp. PG-2 TaxID=754409 RepID=UPI0004588CC8|nr:porin family protein [Winogradskyella sp. PG-2]BAO77669.1 hypothetical protein WPG_3439 [Winogradskyella sp. PG-2]